MSIYYIHNRLLVSILILLAFPRLAFSEWVFVSRVVDGDTFVISDGTKVRVRSIDTPETKHPTKGKEVGGDEATNLAKLYLENRYVWLEGNSKDKYGRRLAVVLLPSGVNYADIVKARGLDKLDSKNDQFTIGSYKRRNESSGAHDVLSSNPKALTWVDGHFRGDGKWVSGYWRKQEQAEISPKPSESYHVDYTETSTSNTSGTVNVNGYYRKDGTYVRPHTRSSPGK